MHALLQSAVAQNDVRSRRRRWQGLGCKTLCTLAACCCLPMFFFSLLQLFSRTQTVVNGGNVRAIAVGGGDVRATAVDGGSRAGAVAVADSDYMSNRRRQQQQQQQQQPLLKQHLEQWLRRPLTAYSPPCPWPSWPHAQQRLNGRHDLLLGHYHSHGPASGCGHSKSTFGR